MTKNFALIGAAGYVAPRHCQAIRDTGNRLVAATDPHDAVGVLDKYFLDVKYFPEIERFDRHIEKLSRGPAENRIDTVAICSPNYLHDTHIRMALRTGANVICEKPLVINPWNLDYLQMLEEESGRTVNTILQLRLHPDLIALKQKIDAEPADKRHQVELTYITGRGSWYHVSWKGIDERSGGLAMNIGIHFFDMLMWLFGPVENVEVSLRQKNRMAGKLALQKADVQWFLSVEFKDLPSEPTPGQNTTHRSITMDGQEIEFSKGFTDLHTRVYQQALAGQGFRLADARPSIELVHQIRTVELTAGRCPYRTKILS